MKPVHNIRTHVRWRPGVWVAMDSLTYSIEGIHLAVDVNQYTDYIIKKLKRRRPR